MGCTPVKLPGGGSAIVCTSERRHRCDFCHRWAEKRCDGPKVRPGRKSKTCDAWLCRHCATSRPGQGDTVDLCPSCSKASAAPAPQGMAARLSSLLQGAKSLEQLAAAAAQVKEARASGQVTGEERAALGTLYLARRAALTSKPSQVALEEVVTSVDKEAGTFEVQLTGRARPMEEIAKDYPEETLQRIFSRDDGPPSGLEKAATEALVTVRRGSYQPRLQPQVGKVHPCVDCGGMISVYSGKPPYRHGGYLLPRNVGPTWPRCEHGEAFRRDCKDQPAFPPCCTMRKRP